MKPAHVRWLSSKAEFPVPSAGVIIKFGTLNLMLDGGTTDLAESVDGLLARPKPGGRVAKLLSRLTSLGCTGQRIRLPSGELGSMGEMKRLWFNPDDTRADDALFLNLATTSLDFGEGIDGLIGFRGIARLEAEHGLSVMHFQEKVQFLNPPLVLDSLTKQWSRQEGYRTASLARLAAQEDSRWRTTDKSAEQALSRAALDRTARMQPAEFAEVIRTFLDQGNYRAELALEEVKADSDVEMAPTTVRRVACEEGEKREAALKEEFADVFAKALTSPPDMEKQRDVQVRTGGWNPGVPFPSHRAMYASIPMDDKQKEFAAAKLDKYVEAGLLEKSTSPFVTPSFCVDKDRSSPDLMKQ